MEFGVADGKNVSFAFYKQTKQENNWADFKKEILHDVAVNHPDLRNYYQRKIYQLYTKYIYAVWILVLAFQVLMGATVREIFLTTAPFIGGSYLLLLTIKKNREQKLNE